MSDSYAETVKTHRSEEEEEHIFKMGSLDTSIKKKRNTCSKWDLSVRRERIKITGNRFSKERIGCVGNRRSAIYDAITCFLLLQYLIERERGYRKFEEAEAAEGTRTV